MGDIEGKGRWPLAKARQLKEQALRTSDQTRRKHFLLIAAEYQKLARQEDGAVALAGVERLGLPRSNDAPQRGVVTKLRLAPRQQRLESNVPARPFAYFVQAFHRREIVVLTICAILVAISFTLVLIPGDQTMGGLRQLLSGLADLD
jgi:hypothetical protein